MTRLRKFRIALLLAGYDSTTAWADEHQVTCGVVLRILKNHRDYRGKEARSWRISSAADLLIQEQFKKFNLKIPTTKG